MYPIPPVGVAITGFSTMFFASLGVALVLLGILFLRAATVRLDPDARR